MKKNQAVEAIKGLKTKLGRYSKILILLVILFFISTLVRNIFKAFDIRRQIEREKEKVETLKKEKEELERRVAEVESNAYMEKQLRDKLGLAKEGEIVLVMPEDEILKKIAPLKEHEEDLLPDPIWKRWLNLFL